LADEELAEALRAAIGGDESGIAVLWRTLHPPVLRYLRVVVGDAAEDVASETWLQAVRGLRTFTGDTGAFRVWLFRIARHRGIDERRRQGRRREDPLDLVGDVDTRSAARDAALDAIESGETVWALRLIARLPPDQGEAVMLRVVAGLDVEQTAQVLSKSPGAVRVAAMRGLRRLAADPQVQERRATRAPFPRTGGAPAEGV
jgi:RNA polymerase sigma-70 factor (ECF subfamily)